MNTTGVLSDTSSTHCPSPPHPSWWVRLNKRINFWPVQWLGVALVGYQVLSRLRHD